MKEAWHCLGHEGPGEMPDFFGIGDWGEMHAFHPNKGIRVASLEV